MADEYQISLLLRSSLVRLKIPQRGDTFAGILVSGGCPDFDKNLVASNYRNLLSHGSGHLKTEISLTKAKI